MSDNKKPKTRGVSLKSPADVRRISQKIISDICRAGTQIEHAGKVNNLLVTWLKAWELEKLSDIERRLTILERERKNEV